MLSVAIVPESIEYNIPGIPPSLLMSFLTWAILIVISVIVIRKPSLVPGKLQLIVESALEYVYGLADQMIGPTAPRYYPLLVGVFLYILVGNLLGLIPGMLSPTADLNVPFGMAFMVFLYYNFEGIRRQGLGYFKHFLGPKLPWYMAPLTLLFILTEVLSFVIRPFSLGLRLFCNVFSKELFLEILAILTVQFILSPELLEKWFTAGPLILRPVILLLGLILGLIQALVFLVLSISYIAGAVHSAEH